MEIKILENNNILVKKNDRYFLIEKYIIAGTCYQNYAIYEDIYNDLEHFIEEDNNDKYEFNVGLTSLEQCFKIIQELD